LSTVEIVFVAFALSIDAFAVAMAASAAGRITGRRAAWRLSFHFGIFQFLMPILGWAGGAAVAHRIATYDHWVAFALLSVVGLRMLWPRGDEGSDGPGVDPSRGLTLVALSTAVSIDALAVGLSLALLQVDVLGPSIVIGVVASAMSVLGILLGGRLQARFGQAAERFGGVVLLLIALRIVVEHAR
jgi:manganese efflux pump family protein